MNQQEQNKIEQMLKSDNIDDVNLAGILIKQKLGLTDGNLKLLYKFIDLLYNQNMKKSTLSATSRFELLRQLMQGDIHQIEIETSTFTGFTQPYTGTSPYFYTTKTDPYSIPGDCTLISDGTITLTNDTKTT